MWWFEKNWFVRVYHTRRDESIVRLFCSNNCRESTSRVEYYDDNAKNCVQNIYSEGTDRDGINFIVQLSSAFSNHHMSDWTVFDLGYTENLFFMCFQRNTCPTKPTNDQDKTSVWAENVYFAPHNGKPCLVIKLKPRPEDFIDK